MAATDPNGVLPTPEQPAPFESGDRVLVRGGPMSGQIALFDRMLDNAKCVILVDWLGRYCPVSCFVEDLLKQPNAVAPKPPKKKRRRHRHRPPKFVRETNTTA
jgi:hypothetical protein